MPFLHTHEQLLVTDENIGVQDRLNNFWTPHVIRSMMMSKFANRSQYGQDTAFVKSL